MSGPDKELWDAAQVMADFTAVSFEGVAENIRDSGRQTFTAGEVIEILQRAAKLAHEADPATFLGVER